MRIGDTRTGRASAALILAMLLAMGLVVSTERPALAQTTLDVQVGLDGYVRFGRQTPIRIVITTDRLIDGYVQIKSTGGMQGALSQRADVQIAGGTTKEITLVVPIPVPQFGGNLEVALYEDGTKVASSNRLGIGQVQPVDGSLVGVFPELIESTPGQAESFALSAETVMRALPPTWLSLPGAIDGIDVIALTPNEFAALPDHQRDDLASWAYRGGVLAIVGADRAASAASAGDFDGIEAIDGPQAYGLGGVNLIPTTSDWHDHLRPTRVTVSLDGPGMEMFGAAMFFGPTEPVSFGLAQDAGVRLPSLPWLTGLLIAYVIIAGPVAWFVLRRLKRTSLLWVVLPAVALVFTVAVWLAGSSLRSGTDTAHATTLQITPTGAYARTAHLLTSRSGGETSLEVPDRWRLDQASSSPFSFNGSSSDGAAPPQGIDMLGSPRASATLDAGGFAIARVAGPAQGYDRALTVTAESAEHDLVTGTVTNNLAVDLHDVGLFADQAGTNLGTIPAGSTVDFSLRGQTRDPFRGMPIEQRVWPAMFMFDGPFPQVRNQQQASDDGSAFSSALWSEYSVNEPLGRPMGQVLVAGFTRELPSPIDDNVVAGRTMVLARSTIAAVDGSVTNLSVLAEPVKAANSFDNFGPGGGPEFTSSWKFTLPTSWSADRELVLTVPARAYSVQVWSGTGWDTLDTSQDKTRPAVLLPDHVVHGREIYVRVALDFEQGPPNLAPRSLAVREPIDRDTPIDYVVATDEQDEEGGA